jgi:hypothetical protein
MSREMCSLRPWMSSTGFWSPVVFFIVTPCYPSAAAFTDPTHVNIITPGTHKYFSDNNFAKGLPYGFTGEFKTLSAGWYPWAASWLLNTTMNSPMDSGSKDEDGTKSQKLRFSRLVTRARDFFGLFGRGYNSFPLLFRESLTNLSAARFYRLSRTLVFQTGP